MISTLMIVAPVFALLIIGFLLAQFGLLDVKVEEGLSRYVFALAIPALLCRTTLSAHMPNQQPWTYWLAYFMAVLVVWIIITSLARAAFKKSKEESVIFAFSAAQSNTAMVGIPLITEAVGPSSATPLALLLSVHLPILTVMGTLLLENSGDLGLRKAGRNLLRMLTTHPILIGIYLGLIGNMLDLQNVQFLSGVINYIAASATPCSLIAMGIALRHHSPAGEVVPASIISFLKLIIHPLLVYIFTKHVFSMPVAWSSVSVLFAACPSGVNAYLFASKIGAGKRVASASISISTLAAIVTMSAWIFIIHTWP